MKQWRERERARSGAIWLPLVVGAYIGMVLGFFFCGIKTLGSRVMGLSCQEVLFYRFLNLGFWACRSQDLQLYS